MLQEAGFRVLRDQWAEVRPGLLIAGVDDLTARRRYGQDGNFVEQGACGSPVEGRHYFRLAYAMGGRRGGTGWSRIDALRPYAQRTNLAFHLHRPAYVPTARRKIRSEPYACHRLPWDWYVGTAHAPVAPERDRSRDAAQPRGIGTNGVSCLWNSLRCCLAITVRFRYSLKRDRS
jgi:hypothetical protein